MSHLASFIMSSLRWLLSPPIFEGSQILEDRSGTQKFMILFDCGDLKGTPSWALKEGREVGSDRKSSR